MSISGVSDLLDAPEGLDSLDDGLADDLMGEADEDSSLLDAALGDVSTGDKDPLALTPTEEPGDSLVQDDTNDSIQVEEDPEIEAIKARVKEMEEEAEKLKELQGEVEKQMSTKSPSAFPTAEEKQDADLRSVYVGNVDYQSTAEELGQHFQSCGPINRVTILCDKSTGHPKGYAYVEFVEKSSVTQAVELDESLFKGRQIKVGAKRTNRPGMSATNRGGRSRGGRWRGGGGGFRGAYNPYMGGMMMMPMPPMGYYRGRGRPFRGRAKTNWYAPY